MGEIGHWGKTVIAMGETVNHGADGFPPLTDLPKTPVKTDFPHIMYSIEV